MNVPTHLEHKPIIGVKDYNLKDDPYDAANTDAQALSLGRPHYDSTDFSAKVFRFKKDSNRWSRQSEELPLHRVLDLAILIIRQIAASNNKNITCKNLEIEVIDKKSISELNKFLTENEIIFKPKLEELRDIVDTVFPKKP